MQKPMPEARGPFVERLRRAAVRGAMLQVEPVSIEALPELDAREVLAVDEDEAEELAAPERRRRP